MDLAPSRSTSTSSYECVEDSKQNVRSGAAVLYVAMRFRFAPALAANHLSLHRDTCAHAHTRANSGMKHDSRVPRSSRNKNAHNNFLVGQAPF
jgi:hypothetical protein